MKNHLGQYECKLCLTIHNTEASIMIMIIIIIILCKQSKNEIKKRENKRNIDVVRFISSFREATLPILRERSINLTCR